MRLPAYYPVFTVVYPQSEANSPSQDWQLGHAVEIEPVSAIVLQNLGILPQTPRDFRQISRLHPPFGHLEKARLS